MCTSRLIWPSSQDEYYSSFLPFQFARGCRRHRPAHPSETAGNKPNEADNPPPVSKSAPTSGEETAPGHLFPPAENRGFHPQTDRPHRGVRRSAEQKLSDERKENAVGFSAASPRKESRRRLHPDAAIKYASVQADAAEGGCGAADQSGRCRSRTFHWKKLKSQTGCPSA